MDRRGLFSIDVLFAMTLLLTVVGTLSNVYQGRDEAATWIGAGEEASVVCEKLAAAVNTVYANGSTSELYINLPDTIRGNSYTISFDNTRREITIEVPDVGITGRAAKAMTSCKNVAFGSLDPSKRVRVRWSGGNVEVTNA